MMPLPFTSAQDGTPPIINRLPRLSYLICNQSTNHHFPTLKNEHFDWPRGNKPLFSLTDASPYIWPPFPIKKTKMTSSLKIPDKKPLSKKIVKQWHLFRKKKDGISFVRCRDKVTINWLRGSTHFARHTLFSKEEDMLQSSLLDHLVQQWDGGGGGFTDSNISLYRIRK